MVMNMRIKDLPLTEQPRERMLLYGVENLSNADLISIIIRTGVRDSSVRDVSENILNKVGSINNLSSIGIRELSKIKGVGNVKAITLMAAIELGKRVASREIIPNMKLNNTHLVHDTFAKFFHDLKQEKFMAIYLDNKKCLISYKTLFIGTIDKVILHPREIFNEAIKVNASSIICIHNHPSGNILPSNEDIKFTEQLKDSGALIGIPLIDHIITNGKEYYSFYNEKIISV